MNKEQLSNLEERLIFLTPVLIDDLLASYRSDPNLTAHYDSSFLRPMADQAATSFRNVLVGAYLHDSPGLVASELAWLTRMLEARQINVQRIHFFLQIFKERLRADLSPEDSEPVIKFLKRVEEDYNERELIRKFNAKINDGHITSN